ncbi:MAG: hypothetical protein LBG60_11270 [Bifidobacteriaceae bacterium]|nr:hypothetical protein [Bifidobacteriaceae bacterium]
MMKKTGRVKRGFAVLALAGVIGLLASGCARMQMEFTVKSDDTFTAQMTAAVADSALEAMAAAQGVTVEELIEQAGLESEFRAQFDLESEGITTEKYSADGYTGWTFTDTAPHPMSEFSDTADLTGEAEDPEVSENQSKMELRRDGDEFILSGVIDLTGMEADIAMMQAMPGIADAMDKMDISMVFIFPGEVKSSTGQIDGNKVTFEFEIGQLTEVEAVASAKPSFLEQFKVLGLVIGVVAIAAGLFIGLLTVKKRRAQSQPADLPLQLPGAAYPSAAPPAAFPGQPPGPMPSGGYPGTPPTFAPAANRPPDPFLPPAAPVSPPVAGFGAAPGQAPPAQVYPGQVYPGQVFPAQAPPAQAFPAQAPPAQAFPAQVLPTQAFPGQAAPTMTPGLNFDPAQPGFSPPPLRPPVPIEPTIPPPLSQPVPRPDAP